MHSANPNHKKNKVQQPSMKCKIVAMKFPWLFHHKLLPNRTQTKPQQVKKYAPNQKSRPHHYVSEASKHDDEGLCILFPRSSPSTIMQ